MGYWRIANAFCTWCLCVGIVTATPVNTLHDDALQLIQTNLSALNVPAAFKVELTPNTAIDLDPEQIYRTALSMMWQITGLPLTQPWFDETWHISGWPSAISIRHNTFGKEPSHLLTQYLIWAMNHMLLTMQLTKFCETTAVLKWEGRPVGSILVAPHARTGGPTSSHRDITQLVRSRPDSPGALTNKRLSIRLAYGDKELDRNVLFLTCVKAMGEAAERGLTALVPGMETKGLQRITWKLFGKGRDIEADFSREVAATAVGRMVLDTKFREVAVWVDVDGEPAAIGGFTQKSTQAS